MCKEQQERKFFIGIDPGKTGALAVLDEKGKYVKVIDFADLLDFKLLKQLAPKTKACYLEKVHAMRGQGVSSTFAFGENFGWWKGVLETLEVRYELKAPQTWQKGLGLKKESPTDKPSLDAARKLFPSAPLQLQKYHGRSDALMIAYKCYLENK